jgi:hypothetical protein
MNHFWSGFEKKAESSANPPAVTPDDPKRGRGARIGGAVAGGVLGGAAGGYLGIQAGARMAGPAPARPERDYGAPARKFDSVADRAEAARDKMRDTYYANYDIRDDLRKAQYKTPYHHHLEQVSESLPDNLPHEERVRLKDDAMARYSASHPEHASQYKALEDKINRNARGSKRLWAAKELSAKRQSRRLPDGSSKREAYISKHRRNRWADLESDMIEEMNRVTKSGMRGGIAGLAVGAGLGAYGLYKGVQYYQNKKRRESIPPQGVKPV